MEEISQEIRLEPDLIQGLRLSRIEWAATTLQDAIRVFRDEAKAIGGDWRKNLPGEPAIVQLGVPEDVEALGLPTEIEYRKYTDGKDEKYPAELTAMLAGVKFLALMTPEELAARQNQ